MQHTGFLFLGRTKPATLTAPNGDFRLELLLIHNMGHKKAESYRVAYDGEAAQTFWKAHRADLVPGAILRAELSHLRVHAGSTYPPVPELRARVVSLEHCPKRPAAVRETADTQA